MAAPVIAPIAPPINAPPAVLFCVPSGFWQPVSTTAVTATDQVKACILNDFIISQPVHQTEEHKFLFKKFNRVFRRVNVGQASSPPIYWINALLGDGMSCLAPPVRFQLGK
jgi:hypothetical protein